MDMTPDRLSSAGAVVEALGRYQAARNAIVVHARELVQHPDGLDFDAWSTELEALVICEERERLAFAAALAAAP